jgi:hypothetical protein
MFVPAHSFPQLSSGDNMLTLCHLLVLLLLVLLLCHSAGVCLFIAAGSFLSSTDSSKNMILSPTICLCCRCWLCHSAESYISPAGSPFASGPDLRCCCCLYSHYICAGVSMFIPAGTSLSFTGSSSTAALDAWITTANSRMFTSNPAPAAAAAGETEATAAAVTGDAAGKTGAGTGGVVQGSSGGLEPGVGFTAAEQVAAAVMAGAAGSSCPVNAQDASAAAAAGGGQAAMETD